MAYTYYLMSFVKLYEIKNRKNIFYSQKNTKELIVLRGKMLIFFKNVVRPSGVVREGAGSCPLRAARESNGKFRGGTSTEKNFFFF